MRHLTSRGTFALTAGLCLLLAGCSLVRLRVQSKTLLASVILAGRVSSTPTWRHPVVVVAWTERDGLLKPSGYKLLRNPGEFELVVPKGKCRLAAFGDANGNLALDPDEPFGSFSGFGPFAAFHDVVSPLDLTLAKGDVDELALRFSQVHLSGPTEPLSDDQGGAIVTLDNEIFSGRNGKRGYWAPGSVLEQRGANIYFLEPYDPRRTPVLFVHGAAGTPQDWKYLIGHLDRSRFQPWIFHFPSGLGVGTVSDLLSWKLSNLRTRFPFDTLQIAAHSMGGLVVRSFLIRYHDRFPWVKLFVSFSTPWGGEVLAKLAPPSIPAWSDMRPGGKLLASLFQRKIPPEVDFFLFFGYRGNRSLLRSENDSVIALQSELHPAAQAEARRVFGFAETHVGILSSEAAMTTFNALLHAYSPPKASLKPAPR